MSNPYYVLYEVDGKRTCCIRGTFSSGDAKTDLDIEPVPVQVGDQQILVQGGFLRAAMTVFENLKSQQFLQQGMVFAGHSMGGAIASILCLLCLQIGVQTTAYGFEVPPCISLCGCVLLKPFVTCVYTERDVVPLACEHQFRTMLTRAVLKKNKQEWEMPSKELASSVAKEWDLFTPGTLFHIFKGDIFESEQEYYGEMNFNMAFVTDHFCGGYLIDVFQRKISELSALKQNTYSE